MGKIMILKAGGGTSSDELTATKDKVLTGYTAVTGDSGDDPAAGTMPNRGAVSQSLNAGGSYTIPAGYHNGAGKVTANSLSSQTSANATAAQILSGQTAWVNGAKVTGSMTNRGAANQALAINGSYTIPAGYHNGSGKVTQSVPVQGGSTTTPGTANKTVVAANRYVNGNVIVAGNGNLTAGNIKKGVSIFGVTGTWSGYVPSSTDLYLRGNNIKDWRISNNYASIDSGQITVSSPSGMAGIASYQTINMAGFSKFNIEYNITRTNAASSSPQFYLKWADVANKTESTTIAIKTLSKVTGNGTVSFDISAVQINKYIRIDAWYMAAAIYRIWLS